MSHYSSFWGNKPLPGIGHTGKLKCTKTGKLIFFGDFVKGYTKSNKYYEGQVNEVGGGTLGVWYKDEPIEIHPENGGDVIATIVLVKRAIEKEKINLSPANEAIFFIGETAKTEDAEFTIIDKVKKFLCLPQTRK